MRPRTFHSAVLLAVLLLRAAPAAADGVLPSAATPVEREQAQARFLRGKELISKKHYDEALVELRASREIVASPNTRLEIARCLLATGHIVAAYAEFGRTAVEAKELTRDDQRYQRTLDAATQERADIEPSLAFVSLTLEHVPPGSHVTVDGEEILPAAWGDPAPVRPGTTKIVVQPTDGAPVERSVTLAAGERQAVTIDVHPAPPVAEAAPAAAVAAVPPPQSSPPRWMRPTAYVAAGAGALGLAAFGVFGLMARSTYDDLNGACPDGRCTPDKSGEISSGRTDQTIANVGLALGVAGVAAGAVLFVLSTPGRSGTAGATGLVISPTGVAVRGSL